MKHGRPREVDSSVIRRVLYVADKQMLYIEFIKTGDVYSYAGVEQEDYMALMSADSVGSYFTRNLRKKYSAVKEDPAVWTTLLAALKPVEIPPQGFMERLKQRPGSVGF